MMRSCVVELQISTWSIGVLDARGVQPTRRRKPFFTRIRSQSTILFNKRNIKDDLVSLVLISSDILWAKAFQS